MPVLWHCIVVCAGWWCCACQLCSLKEEQLQQLGLTSGACKKFLTSIESRQVSFCCLDFSNYYYFQFCLSDLLFRTYCRLLFIIITMHAEIKVTLSQKCCKGTVQQQCYIWHICNSNNWHSRVRSLLKNALNSLFPEHSVWFRLG